MSYQQCPTCYGTGLSYTGTGSKPFVSCPVCKGQKIIDSVSGLPPLEHVQKYREHKENILRPQVNEINNTK